MKNLKIFGKLIETLRGDLIEEDKGILRKLSRRLLAERTKKLDPKNFLCEHQIVKIEKGERNLRLEVVNVLSRALELNYSKKIDFYALAGFFYSVPNFQSYRTIAERSMIRYAYPSHAITPLWNTIG